MSPEAVNVAVVVAVVLGVYGVGAFIVYAVQAAMARDWKTAGAYVVVLVSVLAVGFVALYFNP